MHTNTHVDLGIGKPALSIYDSFSNYTDYYYYISTLLLIDRYKTMNKSVTTYYTQTDCCDGYGGNGCIRKCVSLLIVILLNT